MSKVYWDYLAAISFRTEYVKYEDVQRLRQSTHPCEFEMYYSL